MGETDLHRQDMMDLIAILQDRYQNDPNTYVSGNLLVFYEQGNRRKHISPDVFMVRGVKKSPRDNYLIWVEGKGPDLVIEITSKTTREEDEKKKWLLYRDVLKVPEYIQFDPTEDYLRPSMQGHRLIGGEYVPIDRVEGRLPSEILGLHFERDGVELRLFDPVARQKLLTRAERIQVDSDRMIEAQTEIDRLRLEIKELRKRLPESS